MLSGGIGTDSNTAAGRRIRLDFRFEPSALLALAHEHEAKCSIRDGVLTVRDNHGTNIRINVSTGRLFEVGSEKSTDRLTFQKGRFDRNWKEVQTAAAKHANSLDHQRPVHSIGQFMAAEEPLWDLLLRFNNQTDKKGEKGKPKIDPVALRAARKLLAKGILDPFDDLLAAWRSDWNELSFEGMEDLSTQAIGSVGVVAWWTLPVIDAVFPRGSWPWALGRQAVLASLGRPEGASEEFFKLYASHRGGPVSCLLASVTAELLGSGMARPLAGKGLGHLGLVEFRRDCWFLFEDDDRLGPHLSSTISALGELDDNEIAALLKDLPSSDAKYVIAGVRTLHENKNCAPAVALSTALNAMWNAGLCERVQEALINLEGTHQSLQPSTLADRPVSPREPLAVPADCLTNQHLYHVGDLNKELQHSLEVNDTMNQPVYHVGDLFSTTPPK
jgi:hypothetical protein